jgi:hypothetical protein
MFHLVEDTFSRVEGNLIHAGRMRDSWFSMWFNLAAFIIVVGGFIYFLYSSYGTTQTEKNSIEFKPQTWLNAVRNVPGDQDYGQIPETEIRGGISGFANRSSTSAF